MTKSLPPTIPPRPALADGEGHGHADDKHEKRLDQIPGVQAIPRVVLELPADATEQRAMQGWVPEQLIEAGCFSDEHEHRQAAEEIERNEPAFGGGRFFGAPVFVGCRSRG